MNATYSTLLAAVAPVFVVLACGFALRRFGKIRHEADSSFLTLAVNFLYPCLIADTVLGNPALREPRNFAVAPVVGLALLLLSFAIAALAARLLRLRWPQPARTFAFTAAIPNWGYLPIPLVQKLFPAETTGVLFIHNIGLEIGLWSAGVWLLSGEGSMRRALNVPFFAILSTLVLNFFHAGDWLPSVALDSLHFLGQAAIPLSLILTGATLADAIALPGIGHNFFATAIGCIVRHAILPLLFLAVARWLPCTIELKRVLVVQAAMPCAMVPVLLSRFYLADIGTAVQIVIASTVIGLLTIPLWLRVGFAFVGL